jgi:hypothetical protein
MSIKKISMNNSKMKFRFLKEKSKINIHQDSKGTVTIATFTKSLVDENPYSA